MKYKSKILSLILLLILVFMIFASCKTKPVQPSAAPSTQSENTIDKQRAEVPLRFIVMADSRGSDMGVNTEAVTKTLETIKKISPQPSFAVLPGDLVGGSNNYSEIKAQLKHFKDIITKYYPIEFFYPGFGNHEATAGINGEQAFNEVFSEFNANLLEGYHKTVYYFDKNSIRFYMLNSNHPGEDHQISDTQLNWLKANTNSKSNHNFYFFHEPAYPTGAHIGSSLDANRTQRDKFWTLIDSSQNPIAFCGHEHNYTRRHINSVFNETVNGESFKFSKSVYQVTTGTFGAPIYRGYGDSRNVDVPPIPEYHFAVVDVTSAKTKVTVYNLDGKVLDYFEQ